METFVSCVDGIDDPRNSSGRRNLHEPQFIALGTMFGSGIWAARPISLRLVAPAHCW